MNKIFKRIVVAVATMAVITSVPLMSACESSHPEAVITISYDGVEYELHYKLYRSMYPQTVRHFIELADAGFYDNTIIHNYASSYIYGGGYSYEVTEYESDYETDFEEGEGAMREFLETHSKESLYYSLFTSGRLTTSVYRDYIDGSYIGALPSVIGEVGDTHVIQHGALTGGFGALRMYYSDKSDLLEEGDVVYLDKDGNEDGAIFDDYAEHSATSIFSIQTSTSSGSSSYCIFGELLETQPLTDLISAISSGSTLSVSSVAIDEYDPIVGERGTNTTTYAVTSLPIIVLSVEITRY